ncbi:hypothetical protein [Bacillus phage SDFMU_Pbc]|uniref:Uncharacterized protein n=1 Tax=Bacillus phage SDFMU_Pbc TaxID=3076135 RepID=A0AA96KR33_9CAUD|nr:hypothetical protein [Bacillus phage SDFMU_Pbc]
MEKNLRELNTYELRQVWDKNPKLRYNVSEDLLKTERHYVAEKMAFLCEYVDYYRLGDVGGFIRVHKDFLNEFYTGFSDMDASMPALLTDDAKYHIDKMRESLSKLSEEPDNTFYQRAAFNACQEAANAVSVRFQQDINFCHDENNQFDHFVHHYIDNYMLLFDEYTVDMESFKLHKKVLSFMK